MGKKLAEENSEITDPEDLRKFIDENIHKVRSCIEYYDEYKECTKIKGRFHQYFIFGKFLDCDNWQSDLKNCEKYQLDKDKNVEVLASIIRHEDERREQRLNDHLKNDVWPKRTEPPSNWKEELPNWFIQKKETEEKLIPPFADYIARCVIS